MKLASQNRRSAFVLILLAVLLLFTVVGFAAGESSVAEAAQNGVATLRGYINRGIEKLKDANYIGNACRSAFEGLGNIKHYWWIIIGVIALIECFFCYRLFRLELALIGFIVGSLAGKPRLSSANTWILRKAIRLFFPYSMSFDHIPR